jgi:hypothetical protein
VKRGSWVLSIVAVTAVFVGVLALNLPASWFSFALPGQVKCRSLGGSVWHGDCQDLQFQGASLGDASWNLSPGSALAGRLDGDLQVSGKALNASADLDTRFSGEGELRNLRFRLVIDPALLPQLPAEQRGTVTANFNRALIGPAGAPRALDGTVELTDLRQVGARPMVLGSYRATFDGATSPDGSLRGKLRDLGGPFIVDATLTLKAPNNYVVQGFITGRTAESERLVREITLGAAPDASGRSAFSFEGTW